ncbi:hypothetical protein, partial [Xenorhabdus koppenhoeferi]|uniref:hypothetical protein n=1 Tax=Xenorhabdus koppenhoeferi TaxID=351659 RepID=UPI002B40D16B
PIPPPSHISDTITQMDSMEAHSRDFIAGVNHYLVEKRVIGVKIDRLIFRRRLRRNKEKIEKSGIACP